MEQDLANITSAAELHRIWSMVRENAASVDDAVQVSGVQRAAQNESVYDVEMRHHRLQQHLSRSTNDRIPDLTRQASTKKCLGTPPSLPREDSSGFNEDTPNFDRLNVKTGGGEVTDASYSTEQGEQHIALNIGEQLSAGGGPEADGHHQRQPSAPEQLRAALHRLKTGKEGVNGMVGISGRESDALGDDSVNSGADDAAHNSPPHMAHRGGALAVLAPLRIMRLRSRSRMADPHPFEVQVAEASKCRPPVTQPAISKPEAAPQMSIRKSGAIKKSGFIGSSNLPPVEEEEEDPFMYDEMDIKKRGCSWFGFLQWAILLLLIGGLFLILYMPRLRGSTLLSIHSWKWVVLLLTVFSGRLISGWIIGIIVHILERRLLEHRRLLYFIYGLRSGVRNVVWGFMVWIMFGQLFSNPLQGSASKNIRNLEVLGQLLLCYVVGACLWLLKILLLKLLALNFHVSTYFERIQSALYNQYLMEALSTPPQVDSFADEKFEDPLAAGWSAAGSGGGHGPWDGRSGAVVTADAGDDPKLSGRSSSQWSSWLSWNGTRRRNKTGKPDEETPSLSTIEESEKEEKIGHNVGLTPGSISRRNVTHAETPRSGVRNGMHPQTPKSGAGQSRRTVYERKSKREACKEEAPISILKVQKLTRQHVTPWSMKRLVHMVRATGVSIYTTSLVDNDVEEGKDVEIQNELQAKQAAKQIFINLAMPGQRYITLDDLRRVLTSDEVEKVFALFDGAMEHGKITKKALKNWVVTVYRERRALSLSLNDSRTAIKKLQRIADTVLALVILIISLLILRIATTQVLVLISSQLLLAVFIFGNTCKTIFEAIIFVFVTHPFDVGDRCVIDDKQYVVEEMNILHTVFLQANNDKVYFPNSVLATKPIANLYRSPDEGDGYSFYITASTTGEKLAALKERLQKYVNGLPHVWHPDPFFFVADIVNGQQMKCTLGLSHSCNGQDQRQIITHRHDLFLEVHRQLSDLGITYQPSVQDVRITSLAGALPHVGAVPH